MRKFCVISNKQFDIDFNGIDARYDDIVIPKRNTTKAKRIIDTIFI